MSAGDRPAGPTVTKNHRVPPGPVTIGDAVRWLAGSWLACAGLGLVAVGVRYCCARCTPAAPTASTAYGVNYRAPDDLWVIEVIVANPSGWVGFRAFRYGVVGTEPTDGH